MVIVDNSILMNKWTGEPENFLKKFQKELIKKLRFLGAVVAQNH